MTKIAVTYSQEVGGLSVQSLRKSFLDLGCEVQDADYRSMMSDISADEFAEAYATSDGRKRLFAYAKANAIEFFKTNAIDCLALSGNTAMVDPVLFGQNRGEQVNYDYSRTIAELALIHVALQKGLPILGICGGHQVLAVYGGGELRPMTSDEIKQQKLMEYDTIWVKKDSILGRIVEPHVPKEANQKTKDSIEFIAREYFGSHNEVVSQLAKDVEETSHSSDTPSLNEALEYKYGAPVLSTQFHPEIGLNDLPISPSLYRANASSLAEHTAVFDYFKHAAQAYRNKQNLIKQLNSMGPQNNLIKPSQIKKQLLKTGSTSSLSDNAMIKESKKPQKPSVWKRILAAIMTTYVSMKDFFRTITRGVFSIILTNKVSYALKNRDKKTESMGDTVNSNASSNTIHDALKAKTPQQILTTESAKKWVKSELRNVEKKENKSTQSTRLFKKDARKSMDFFRARLQKMIANLLFPAQKKDWYVSKGYTKNKERTPFENFMEEQRKEGSKYFKEFESLALSQKHYDASLANGQSCAIETMRCTPNKSELNIKLAGHGKHIRPLRKLSFTQFHVVNCGNKIKSQTKTFSPIAVSV